MVQLGTYGWHGSGTHSGEIGKKKLLTMSFVELADSLSTNLCAVDLEPLSFLNGKVLVSKKLDEVEDILTFIIYQMVI